LLGARHHEAQRAGPVGELALQVEVAGARDVSLLPAGPPASHREDLRGIGVALEQPTPWVAQHQLVQERPDHVVLRLVPIRPPTAGSVAALQAAVLERLGPGIRLDVEVVPEIPLDGNGKLQVARSRVESIYDRIRPERSPGPSPRD
jgi:hypothetical protein